LANNLAGGLGVDREAAERLLAANNIDKTRRAETLDMQEWVNLTRSYSS
jgi:16S rRNA A1518/A1519 N6-dimethyltransferase RsmA/KsgA/DIM1 with predicted DNA glycosylase/AP lyase activity